MRYWHRKKSNSSEMHDKETRRDPLRTNPWRQRFGAALKILSQVVAILGTIMAIVDTLHRWLAALGASPSLQKPGTPCIFGAQAHRCGSFWSFFRQFSSAPRSRRSRFRRRSQTLAVRLPDSSPCHPHWTLI